jgi:single-strand DNA-binding protein
MLNNIQLIGRIGRDPEKRTFDGGISVTRFSVAVSEKYKNKAGEQIETTEWFNIDCWGKLAEVAEQWFKKGQLVYVQGAMKSSKREETTYWQVNAQQVKVLDWGKKEEDGQPTSSPSQPVALPSQPVAAQPVAAPADTAPTDEDDDLPF